MKDIAIYGFGGFGREVACLIAKINEVKPSWNLIGYFDDGQPIGAENKYGRVLGGIESVNEYQAELNLVIAIGSPKVVKHIYESIKNPMIAFPNIIAPDTLFFDKESIKMGDGNIITFGCRLSCNIRLGNFNILNGCVSLGHDVQLGNYNILFPDTRISGQTHIGDTNFFGARSFVAQGLKIGNETRIGVGSVVLRNTKDSNLYMGNPAVKIDL